MSSATAKFLSLSVAQLGVGPHATQLLHELQGAIRAKLPATAIILAATLVDVIRHEDQVFSFDEDDDEFVSDGFDYLPLADRKKLVWLRAMRNQLIHYEGPIEGMMGRQTDTAYLSSQADRAIAALFIILEV